MPSRNTKAWYSSSSTWELVLSRGKALHYHYITGDSPLEATVGQSECKSAEMKQIGVRQSEHPGFSWHGRIPSWVMKLNLKKENGQGERGGKKKKPYQDPELRTDGCLSTPWGAGGRQPANNGDCSCILLPPKMRPLLLFALPFKSRDSHYL